MDWYRIRHTIGMHLCSTAIKRAAYLKKHDILYHISDNCMTMFRKIPLYPKLISMGNNVWIASDVLFVPHDVIHRMLNNKLGTDEFQENLGCIDIKDNVFVGSNSTILPNVTIGPDTIIAAGSLINKSIPGNGVYGGVPAKYICSLDELIAKNTFDTVSLKHKLTATLLKITDECADCKTIDRFGHEVSPAPLRAVAVNAVKTLNDMYGIKEDIAHKVTLEGGDSNGIVFNINVPTQTNKEEEEFND